MTVLRWVVAVVAGAAATTATVMLDWPGWTYAPLGVVLAVSLTYLIAAPRRDLRPGRVDLAMVGLACVLTVATALTAVIGVGDPDRDAADPSVATTASETVRELFTFGPSDYTAQAAARRQESLGPKLTGRLLADHRSQGPNVVLPAAVESGAAVSTTVQAIGVGDTSSDVVRLLVFATEQITVPTAVPPSSTVPIVRWAVMRRVENTWRLADIYPAGIGG